MPLDPGCSSTSQPVNMAHSVAAQMSCLALTGPGLAVWPLLMVPLFCLRINGLLQLLPHEDNSGRLAFVRRLFLHHSTIFIQKMVLTMAQDCPVWPLSPWEPRTVLSGFNNMGAQEFSCLASITMGEQEFSGLASITMGVLWPWLTCCSPSTSRRSCTLA